MKKRTIKNEAKVRAILWFRNKPFSSKVSALEESKKTIFFLGKEEEDFYAETFFRTWDSIVFELSLLREQNSFH